jgi:hypothetical protein
MSKSISAIILTQALLCGAVLAGHEEADPYALEPSINGGVSASGLFASQAKEDAYLAALAAEALEPCINGGVSANGLFASQTEEDAFSSRVVAR